MRGRRFLVTWYEEDTAAALKAAYQGERDREFRTRLQGLWLLRSGCRLLSVAAAVGAHYRTVQRWVGWYREGGVGNVLSHKMGGKGQAPFIDQLEALAHLHTTASPDSPHHAPQSYPHLIGEAQRCLGCHPGLCQRLPKPPFFQEACCS